MRVVVVAVKSEQQPFYGVFTSPITKVAERHHDHECRPSIDDKLVAVGGFARARLMIFHKFMRKDNT